MAAKIEKEIVLRRHRQRLEELLPKVDEPPLKRVLDRHGRTHGFRRPKTRDRQPAAIDLAAGQRRQAGHGFQQRGDHVRGQSGPNLLPQPIRIDRALPRGTT